MPAPKKRFTPEFRDEAVRLARTSGRPRREIAADLGIGRLVGSSGRRNVVGSGLFQEIHDGAHGSSRLIGRAEAGALDPLEGWTIAQ